MLTGEINIRAKLVTREGEPAEFVGMEPHPLFPLIFRVKGALRSYTRQGNYQHLAGPSPLDLVEAR